MTNNRFVVTGGPGSGKTTLLDALTRRGHGCVPESARAVIRDRLAAGLSPRPALDQFGLKILQIDIEKYRQCSEVDGPVFFDRGVPDALCMIDEQGAMAASKLESLIRQYRYNEVVFVMPPWEAIYVNDSERDQTFEEANEVYDKLSKWYRSWGYETVEVPRCSADDRAGFMLERAR